MVTIHGQATRFLMLLRLTGEAPAGILPGEESPDGFPFGVGITAGIPIGEGSPVDFPFGEARSAGILFDEGDFVGISFGEPRETRFRQIPPRETRYQQETPRQTEFQQITNLVPWPFRDKTNNGQMM